MFSKSDKVIKLIQKTINLQDSFGFGHIATDEQAQQIQEVNEKVFTILKEMSDHELAKLKERLEKKTTACEKKSDNPMSKAGIGKVFFGQWSKNVTREVTIRREAMAITDDELMEHMSGSYGTKVEEAEHSNTPNNAPRTRKDTDISL